MPDTKSGKWKVNNADIVEQIERMGGRTFLLDNGWTCFVYRQLHFVNIPDSHCSMVRMSIPHLAKSEDYRKEELERIINETNREIKFIKAVILKNGSVSVSYDHKIAGGEKANEIVPHIVKTLYCASEYLKGKLKKR